MKLIIHGGFFSESSTNHETKVAKQAALSRIAKDSYAFLKTHTAVETVVYAVSLLEDDPLFNAGIGSQIQSDGKIVVSGYTEGDTTGPDFALVRYLTNGGLDPTFDTDGIVITSFGGSFSEGKSIAIQSDGKIVVAGVTGSTISYFALARYNFNGSLDTTFDNDGKVTTLFGGFSDWGYATAIQSDGKIVMVGYSNNGTNPMLNNTDFGVVRYNNNSTTEINTFENQDSETKIYIHLLSISNNKFTCHYNFIFLCQLNKIHPA